MIDQKQWNQLMAGKLYDPYQMNDPTFRIIHEAVKKFNDSRYWEDQTAFKELCQLFGRAPDDLMLNAPVYFDHGNRIYFGDHFFANSDLTILDETDVTFGDYVFLGPHVSIYTAAHPIDAMIRDLGLEYALPVKVGSHVWIGGNVVINPGVSIGDDVVIGSGSVVTHNIPPHVIAAGNPCHIIRKINDDERKKWRDQYQEYLTSLK